MSEFQNREQLTAHQLGELVSLLGALRQSNPFYQAKLRALGTLPHGSAEGVLAQVLALIPHTVKAELVADQRDHSPFGTNLTFPMASYVRCHQTSGSAGSPIRWLDTSASWEAMLEQWQRVFAAAGVKPEDRFFFAFSFGPFLGFWTAFEAATRLGNLCFPGGGLSSLARLHNLIDNQATILCCTPTYALHLGEVAAANQIDLTTSAIRRLIVAGEPGGSIPSTRRRLEALWPKARVCDHHGMTEVGPVTYECPDQPGLLHVMERSYIAEVLQPGASEPVAPGEVGELVLTTLKRSGSPLLRYRTCDLVAAQSRTGERCTCGTLDLGLRGGIIGRTDDMVVVRGVNLYPSAVEEVIRRVGGIAEYQVRVDKSSPLAAVVVQVEPGPDACDATLVADQLRRELHQAFALKFEVETVPPGTLPRFELKAKRWRS
ncbi:MAG: AMP-binding protein [Verrucomicrobiales bacterium]|nr:AMP-binding protein [Verrucomicrobiales bacterium]